MDFMRHGEWILHSARPSAVIRSTAIGVFGLAALSFFFRSYFYSRLMLGIFGLVHAGRRDRITFDHPIRA